MTLWEGEEFALLAMDSADGFPEPGSALCIFGFETWDIRRMYTVNIEVIQPFPI